MLKTNNYYIKEILKNIDFIIEHMKDKTNESLSKDAVLTDSMIFRLIQISESSKYLTDDYKNRYHMVPWSDITALRNRLVHDYGNVDMEIVYNTLTKDIPALKNQLIDLV